MSYREKIYSSYLTNRQLPAVDLDSLESATVWYEKEVLKVLPNNKNIKILELGCGSGYFFYVLKKAGDKSLTGFVIGEEQRRV